MKLFRILAVSATLVSLVVAVMAMPLQASALENTCSVLAIGTQNTAGQEKSRFVLNGDGTVSATFKVTGDENCEQDVTLASWQAPDADKGQPYEQQKLFAHVSGTFGLGTHTLTVKMPDCFYQIDLVRGNVPTGPNGSPVYEAGRMMGSLHGGTKKCEETPPQTPPKTPEPPTEPEVKSEVTTLPNTGIGSNVAIIALLVSVVAGAGHYFYHSRRSTNQ